MKTKNLIEKVQLNKTDVVNFDCKYYPVIFHILHI